MKCLARISTVVKVVLPLPEFLRILESFGELSNIFDHRYLLTEAATERSSLKIALRSITLYFLMYYLVEGQSTKCPNWP